VCVSEAGGIIGTRTHSLFRGDSYDSTNEITGPDCRRVWWGKGLGGVGGGSEEGRKLSMIDMSIRRSEWRATNS
jgi:hypothetical protein